MCWFVGEEGRQASLEPRKIVCGEGGEGGRVSEGLGGGTRERGEGERERGRQGDGVTDHEADFRL